MMIHIEKKVTQSFLLGFFLLTLLFFSSCSILPNTSKINNGQIEKDITGNGLEIDFSLDDSDISRKMLRYNIVLENSGSGPILLNRENFVLDSYLVLNDGSSIFTQESLGEFYTKILGDDNTLKLYQNQKTPQISGVLYLKDNFFKNTRVDKVKVYLSVKYDYFTEFSNNLLIDLKSKDNLKVLDKISQAAPIQITDIGLKAISGDNYELYFVLKDKGKSFLNSESKVQLRNLDFTFRGENLGNCKYLTKTKQNNYIEIDEQRFGFSKDQSELIYTCKVSFQESEKTTGFNTKVAGKFEYNYNLVISKTFDLINSQPNSVWE